MKLRLATSLFGLLLWACPVRAAEPAAGNVLPDDYVLLKVADRVTTVRDYVYSYFTSYPEFRPNPDSLGRVQFLNSLANKDVMGLVAKEVNRPMGFEDRASMREFTERTLSNILFKRAVLDSSEVSDAEVRRMYEQLGTDIHARQIVFFSPDTARRVRGELLKGRLSWDLAHKLYDRSGAGGNGDLGWISRTAEDQLLAQNIFHLKAGQYSELYQDIAGIHLVKCVATRPAMRAALPVIQNRLREIARGPKVVERSERLLSHLRDDLGLTYDTLNITWASTQFRTPIDMQHRHGTPTISIDTRIPRFAPEDTGRVLARWKNGGRFSLRDLVQAYHQITPIARQPLTSPDRVRHQVDVIVLEPQRAELARQMGLDRDSMAVSLIEKRREELMVEHLYQDSIMSKIHVSKEERRRYYDQHLPQFFTYARVRYGVIVADRKTEADSLAAAFRAGESIEAMLKADSLAGREQRGSIRELREDDQGAPFYGLLFQELRPGQVTVSGPDDEQTYAVVQSLSFDSGRQLSFEEADPMVVESTTNLASEKMLQETLDRWKMRYAIESRPELVMRVRLKDPTL